MSSEVQARPAPSRGGRGSGRGGRGGFSSRGGSRNQSRPSATNGDSKHDDADGLPSLEDEGEIGRLKKLYGPKTSMIKELFPDWSDVDILFALQETDGDENLTVTRIAEGTISQWGEVSKPKKERTKAKGKDATFTTTTGDAIPPNNARHTRGGRGGAEGGRGRGRATERGGRAARGRSAHATNGTRSDKTQQLSTPTEESSAWESHNTDEEPGSGALATWDNTPSATTTSQDATATTPPAATPVATPKTAAAEAPPPKTWASMLRQATVPKPPVKPKEAPTPKPVEAIEPLPPVVETPAAPEPEPEVEEVAQPVEEEVPAPEVAAVVVPEIALPPPKDELTESNLEHVADESHPPDTETSRSEAADSWDPRAPGVTTTGTPLSASQHQHLSPKAPASGFAATAMKATERMATRTPSYTRRILDQEEAVRMPGHREVDLAAVQFGNLSFSGIDEDIDGDREEPETRAQPPDDSPVAHPRASLPPVPQPATVPEAFPAQKPATSLPPPPAPATIAPPTAPAAQQPLSATQVPAVAAVAAPTSQQFGRFPPATAQEQPYAATKPFDSFSQQTAPSSAPQYEGFPNQQQQQQQSQPQNQQPGGAYSSAPSDYSSYYTSDQQNRTPYNYYSQNYSQQQQGGQAHQEGLAASQRSFGGYGAPLNDNLNQYPQSSASRYGVGAAVGVDVQNSGNTTPNPPGQAQQQGVQSAQAQSHSQQQQQPHGSQFPFTHPYYSSPYYSQYMNQYTGFGQGGFGMPYGKGGYGQQQPYGMSPQAPYDHNSSQGSGFGQSSLHRGEGGLSTSLGEYGRAGSAQSGNQPGLAGTGFGSMHEGFGRGASSYPSQAGQSFGAQSAQPGAAPSGSDDLKPFGDAKGATGPSPSLAGARPGSATNANPSQSGLPPPQSNPQGGVGMGGGYGGYPSHLQGHSIHGSQSATGGYGMAAAANQNHGNNPYGGYGGQGYSGGSYYGNQPRGWGGNYH